MSKTNTDTSTNDVSANAQQSFADFNLSTQVEKNLSALGYEAPTPIQAAIMPFVQQGRDVLGQAQTGTGKTAAFALPLLSKIDASDKSVQVLVLTPTRELAIQVATAFESYANGIKGLNIMSIYGGQSYDIQLRQLKKGVQVVVGTPGRVMDHLRRGTLKLDTLTSLVLDEADEMLRMGFIDDVEWILDKTPATRQVALFSATMPQEIQRISAKYLKNPEHVRIASKTSTASTIKQSYWMQKASQKMNSLMRILSMDVSQQSDNNAIVFVRTKMATVEITDYLTAKGIACEALNGDVQQKMREKIINKARSGKVKVLVATDVAARGLDIDNITHVINYDIPFDVETYVHRIGRTGRAGRKGEAVLFITPKEQRLLRTIEKVTKQGIDKYAMPSLEDVKTKQNEALFTSIAEQIENKVDKHLLDAVKSNELFSSVADNNDATKLVATLLKMLQQEQQSLNFDDDDMPFSSNDFDGGGRGRGEFREGGRGDRGDRSRGKSRDRDFGQAEEGMARYRIEVGRNNDLQPKNIVGAIANEIGLESKYIGQIKLFDDFSTVDLPEGMPKEVFEHLRKVRVAGLPMNISPYKGGGESSSASRGRGKPGGERSSRKPASGGQGRKSYAKSGSGPKEYKSSKRSSSDKPRKR